MLSPAGPIAQAERHEFMIVGIILLFVLAPVALLVPLIAWHYRIANTHAAFRPQWGFSWILEVPNLGSANRDRGASFRFPGALQPFVWILTELCPQTAALQFKSMLSHSIGNGCFSIPRSV